MTPYTSQEAEAAEAVASQLRELPEAFVVCRDVKHAWAVQEDFHVEPQQSAGARKAPALIRRILVCMRCATERHERYTASPRWGLEKVSNVYHYPDHYAIRHVPRGVKPSWLVQGEQYRRAMERVADAARHADHAVPNGG